MSDAQPVVWHGVGLEGEILLLTTVADQFRTAESMFCIPTS